jgi:hypothetical protein
LLNTMYETTLCSSVRGKSVRFCYTTHRESLLSHKLLTLWTRVLLGKQTVAQRSAEIPECSLTCSQELNTGACAEPDESSPQSPFPILFL